MSVGLVISLGVKSFLKKNIFVILGNPLNRDKNFKNVFYQSIALIHTKTLIIYLKSVGYVCEAQYCVKVEKCENRDFVHPP